MPCAPPPRRSATGKAPTRGWSGGWARRTAGARTISGVDIGRAAAEYAKSWDAPFADPESHYDRLCADEARAACFRLKEPL